MTYRFRRLQAYGGRLPKGASDRVAMKTASKVAQFMAGHSNAKTTGLYDRRNDDINLSEVERIGI